MSWAPSLRITDVCVCACVCVHSGESSIRATTARAVEQERTKSVWKSSPSVKSVGVSSNLFLGGLIRISLPPQ